MNQSEENSQGRDVRLVSTQKSLPMALLKAREAVMERLRPVLSAHGVTEQQWRVLRVLEERGVLDSSTLAGASNLLPPSLTRIMKLMEGRGLISMSRDPQDGRRAQVHITPQGSALIQQAAPEAIAVADEIEAAVGAERLDALLVELDAVSRALGRRERG